MSRPRLLLIPWLTELEWPIKPRLAEWAEVVTYDAPGVSGQPLEGGLTQQKVAWRGLEEIDRAGWDRCFVVADEFALAIAAELALARPEAVEGLALGHACLSYSRRGERPPLNPEVAAAFGQVARTDYRMFARHLSQLTQGAYDDEMTERFIERVPREVALQFEEISGDDHGRIERALRKLDVPMLFAKHQGCLMFTPEGFEDVATAFPDATTVSVTEKPSVSLDFAEALRSFCLESVAAYA